MPHRRGFRMKNNIAVVFLISCLISISTIAAFSQEPKCKKVLIIFSADWCTYCHKAKKDMNEDKILSELIKEYEIIDVDFDIDKDITVGHDIKTIPAFIIFDEGKELRRKTGYRNSRDLINFLK